MYRGTRTEVMVERVIAHPLIWESGASAPTLNMRLGYLCPKYQPQVIKLMEERYYCDTHSKIASWSDESSP